MLSAGTVATKKKAIVLVFLAFINFLGGMGLTLYVDQRFVLIAILIPMLCGLLLLTLRCERCGKPLYRNQVRILGVNFTYWGGVRIPRVCSQCGLDFASSSYPDSGDSRARSR